MESTIVHSLHECNISECIYSPVLMTIHQSVPCRYHDPSESLFAKIFLTTCSACSNVPMANNALCNFCHHLRLHHLLCCLASSSLHLFPTVILGRYEEIQSRHSCVFCGFISQEIKTKEQTTGIRVPGNHFIALEVLNTFREGFATSRSGHAAIYVVKLSHDESKGSFKATFWNKTRIQEICVRDRTSPAAWTAMPKTIDWNRLRNWLKDCETNHVHPGVQGRYRADELQNFYLIDVANECISHEPMPSRYIALSYVWGNRTSGMLEATKDFIDRLQEHGSLRDHSIPTTIRDAMAVCRQFDVRYLWVDRLCIIQDDEVQKHDQINSMGEIFSRALLTICAASGDDAEQGLPGVNLTARQHPRNRTFVLGMEILGWTGRGMNSTWNQRGWTYQENVLSRRRLIFTEQEVFFECNNNSRTEATTPTEIPPDVDIMISPPSGSIYTKHVQKYARRSLSYQNDVYNAFTGIFNSIYPEEDFIYGLPEKDFDEAILWKDFTKPVESIGCQNSFEVLRLPTWSWASRFGHDIRYEEFGSMLGSLIKWRIVHEDSRVRFINHVNSPCAWEPYAEVGPYCHDDFCNPPRQYQSHDSRLYLAIAWEEKLVEAAGPTQLSSDLPFQDTENHFRKKWPTYACYWRQVHPEAYPQAIVSAKRAGQLIFRASVAYFTPQKTPPEDIHSENMSCILCDDKGFPSGYLSLGTWEPEDQTDDVVGGNSKGTKSKVQLVALSCTTVDEYTIRKITAFHRQIKR